MEITDTSSYAILPSGYFSLSSLWVQEMFKISSNSLLFKDVLM